MHNKMYADIYNIFLNNKVCNNIEYKLHHEFSRIKCRLLFIQKKPNWTIKFRLNVRRSQLLDAIKVIVYTIH